MNKLLGLMEFGKAVWNNGGDTCTLKIKILTQRRCFE